MVEKLRLFKGTTELNYSTCKISKLSDGVINSGNISIEADSGVIVGSTIDFKKADGSTTIFSGNVIEKKRDVLWNLKIMTSGYELINLKIEQVYKNRSPEYIVEDIITSYTSDLTFASSSTSGFTIPKYVANAYAIDIIKEMMNLLQWQLRIDESGNVYFEPKGNTDNSLAFTNGTNFQVSEWNEDNQKMFNRVKVRGGTVSNQTQDTGTGDAVTKTFTLTHKPAGIVKVAIDGTEQVPLPENSPYSVDSESKEVVFVTAPGGGTAITFDYEFQVPIVVDYQNDVSIAQYGEIYREVHIPSISSFPDARIYAQNLIDVYSIPLLRCIGYEPFINFDNDVGEWATVTDNIRSKIEKLVITKITYDAQKNQTIYEMGTREFVFFDWQKEVQERIKKIEREIQDEDGVAFSRLFKHELDISLTLSEEAKFNWPKDSFIAGHESLSKARADLNFEADCSNNGHNGIWSGTGIDGSQYEVSGWRLSTGLFNGSDRIITISDHADLDLSSDFTIMMAIKVDTLPGTLTYLMNKWDGTDGWAIRIASDNKVELIYSNSGSDSTIKASTALTAKTFQHVTFVKSSTSLTVYINGVSNNTGTGDVAAGTNSNDMEIGRYSTNYFTDEIDEVRLYSDNLAAATVLSVYNRVNETTNLVGYWSMDNPRAGDRSSPKIIYVSSTSFKLNLSSDDADDNSTAYWDTTNKRLAMSSSNNHMVVYNTIAKTKQIYFTGLSFSTATFTATETIWGSDVIKYYLTNDGNSIISEVFNGTSFTFLGLENDLRIRVVFLGNGGSSTYITNPTIVVTRI